MRKKILAIVFAAALLVALALPVFGGVGTTEAAIDPIVQSQCAAKDSQSGNSGVGSRTAGNDQHPPGQTPGDGPGDSHGNFKGVSNSNGNATSGEGDNHCTNPS